MIGVVGYNWEMKNSPQIRSFVISIIFLFCAFVIYGLFVVDQQISLGSEATKGHQRQQTELYLPFESQLAEHPIFWKEDKNEHFSKIFVGFTKECEGQAVCGFASFETFFISSVEYTGALTRLEQVEPAESFLLANGTPAQYTPSQCGANCSPAYLSWHDESRNTFSRVSTQSSGMDIIGELVRAANSYITRNQELR